MENKKQGGDYVSALFIFYYFKKERGLKIYD